MFFDQYVFVSLVNVASFYSILRKGRLFVFDPYFQGSDDSDWLRTSSKNVGSTYI